MGESVKWQRWEKHFYDVLYFLKCFHVHVALFSFCFARLGWKCYRAHLRVRRLWHSQVPECILDPDLQTCTWNSSGKERKSFEPTSMSWLPTAKSVVPWKRRVGWAWQSSHLQFRNNLGLCAQVQWQSCGISHFGSMGKDVCQSIAQLVADVSLLQEVALVKLLWAASAPGEGGSLRTQSIHSPCTAPGTPWDIWTLTRHGHLLSLGILQSCRVTNAVACQVHSSFSWWLARIQP